MFLNSDDISFHQVPDTPLGGSRDAFDAEPIDLWDAWLFAEAEASLALRAWTDAPVDDRARAYAAYRAALDREEQAGWVLACRVQRLRAPEATEIEAFPILGRDASAGAVA